MMTTVNRGWAFFAGGAAVLALTACLHGCSGDASDFVSSLHREWTSTGLDGAEEHVVFDEGFVTWNAQSDGRYKCPYRVSSFSEKTKTVDITMSCKKRTGTEEPVAHELRFGDDRESFTLHLEGRAVGVYRAASQ